MGASLMYIVIACELEHAMQAHGELEAATCAVLEQQGLQKPAAFVHKILQLHETLGVRFGAMLVGPSGTGKSTLLRTLQVSTPHAVETAAVHISCCWGALCVLRSNIITLPASSWHLLQAQRCTCCYDSQC